MGDSAPQRDARSLREILAGLDRIEQHRVAAKWAKANNRAIDLFGEFARERHLMIFQSGNECENWIDPIDNIVYKMNTLTHVGEDLYKLLTRIDTYNALFPETALRFVGFQVMSETSVFPVFAQPFISKARLATTKEIDEYMQSRGFEFVEDGKYSSGSILLWDIKAKNVLVGIDNNITIIDAEITEL